MLKIYPLKMLFALCSLALVPLNGGPRKVIILKVFPEATVADLFAATKKGHFGLNMPTAPEFTPRGLFSATPKVMKTYPAFYKLPAGTITTASMIRFIKQSPMLFDADPAMKKTYQAATNEWINSHKAWFTLKTPATTTKLHETSEKVLSLLGKLSLSNPITRLCLQRILSTPKLSRSARFWNASILNKRSTISTAFGKKPEKMKLVVQPNKSWKITSCTAQVLKCFGLGILAGVVPAIVLESIGKNDGSSQLPMITFFGALAVSISSIYSRWMSDYNLTAEPESGIKVRIKIDEGEACDNSGTYAF